MRAVLLTIILTSFLSCNENEVRPFEAYQYSINLKKIDIAGEEFISIKDSKCHKRLYRVWRDKVGPLEDFKPVKIEECFLMIGYRPSKYSELWALMEYARKQFEQQETIGQFQESVIGEIAEPVLPGADRR